ncbi:MAG TPA: aminotransferase class III-fold pyridoxal phosphate-dependent enzyme, partial [Candidatus Limnocylindrales bacterium]|nr:aminotransferase class III-fold pyridoxal phosphate-dependent enzyme [Candidatus Limnocylindrales bacterium]
MSSALHIWHPFTHAALDPAPIPVQRAEGVYLYTSDGRRIIDAISSWWVNLHGHANPRIAAAIAEQARKLEHVILAGFSHEAAEELAERLGKWAPEEMTHLFFSDDGSTAVEVSLKLAVQYFENQSRPEKREIVALAHGYHGDTAGAMSVSDESPFTQPFQSMRFPVHRVHSAYCYHCPAGLKRESCHIECVQHLEELLEDRGSQIAAVIVEPLLQGAGGMIVHPVEFLQKVRALCTKHDVLLIADEVLTGFGRTGKMFACD